MPQAETFSLPEIISDEISALVRAGFYSSKSDVAKDALRCLFEHKPHLKITAAVELYNSGEVSLGKASEIAEMNTADFKDALAERGIVRVIKSSNKRVKKGLEIIRKARR
ncbi:UPF0175 family protein [Candidatus Woesearchaeota archaeon]|nr:UPF0175 family protein [Candidatus Woesearchaeota archaeon]